MATNLFRVGALATDDPSQIITLFARVNGGSQYGTFKEAWTTSGYQVPSAKTFYITRFYVSMEQSGSTTKVIPGYGDNDVGAASGVAPTDAKYMGDASGGVGYGIFGGHTQEINTGNVTDTAVVLAVPALKYPFFFSNLSTSICTCWVQGILQDV